MQVWLASRQGSIEKGMGICGVCVLIRKHGVSRLVCISTTKVEKEGGYHILFLHIKSESSA